MSKWNNQQIDPALRAKALELADRIGPAKAAKQLGIAPGTLRSWRTRAGQAGPPRGADPETWAATKRKGAQESWRVAQQALKRVREHLDAGRTADAQRAALTMAILTDKSGVLESAAQQADQRATRITEDQGEQIAEVIRLALEDLDLDHDVVRRVFAARLEGGADLDAAQRAKAQIRREIEREIGADGAPARRREPLALPPASAPHPDGREDEEREEMTPPKKVITTSKPDVVVDAEVVDPDSDPYMPLSVEKSPERDSHRWS